LRKTAWLFTRPPRTAMMNKKLLPIIFNKFVYLTTFKKQLTFTSDANNLLNAADFKAVALICWLGKLSALVVL